MENVFFRFESGIISARNPIVRDVNFSLCRGEKCALIGETGAGKTMIALAVMGLLPDNVSADGLKCQLDGVPVDPSVMLGRKMAYIPQNGMDFLNPSLTVGFHMKESLKRAGKDYGKKDITDRLAKVGFEDPGKILKSYPFELSGGMAQRVTIALTLCTDAELIIADEPTNGLDREAADRMMNHLSELFSSAAMLMITHNISDAAACDSVMVLCNGHLMEKGPSFILKNPESPYTKALLSSLVENGMKPFPPLRERTECPFSGRCPEYTSSCRSFPKAWKKDNHEWWCRND